MLDIREVVLKAKWVGGWWRGDFIIGAMELLEA